MAGQASLPAPLCGPSSPSVHATAGEGEGVRGGVGVGGGISLCRVCVCVCVRVCVCASAYFLRPDVFTVRRSLALCLGVLAGLIAWCQNCHGSKVSTYPKRGQKNHFEKI